VIKIIVLAVLGLLVGLGGGSAFSVFKAKQGAHAKVVADSVAKAHEEGTKHGTPAEAKDSARVAIDSAPPADLHAQPVGAGTSKSGTATTSPKPAAAAHPPVPQPAATDSAAGKHAVTAPPAKAPAPWNRAVTTVQPRVTAGAAKGSAGASATPTIAPKAITPDKIAKIFAAMPARDAAKVLEQLEDSDVQQILGALSGKQAAAILQTFPPNRAAAISKAALRSGVTKP
jgi:hypothetical protein